MVQRLRLHIPNAGGPGSIPGQGTRSHMPQLKILHAATKTCFSKQTKHGRLVTDKHTGLGEPQGYLQGFSEDKEQCQLKPRAWLGSRGLQSLCTVLGMSPECPPSDKSNKGKLFLSKLCCGPSQHWVGTPWQDSVLVILGSNGLARD